MTTCLPHSKNASYMLLNLVGEVGEIAGKVSKVIRKGDDITFEWMQDERCRVENQFLKEGKLYERW